MKRVKGKVDVKDIKSKNSQFPLYPSYLISFVHLFKKGKDGRSFLSPPLCKIVRVFGIKGPLG